LLFLSFFSWSDTFSSSLGSSGCANKQLHFRFSFLYKCDRGCLDVRKFAHRTCKAFRRGQQNNKMWSSHTYFFTACKKIEPGPL
jgi:hypothetical protein